MRLRFLVLALSSLSACNGDSKLERADETMLADQALIGGTVYTMDSDAPLAKAVALRSGRIIYVGGGSSTLWERLMGSTGTELVSIEHSATS